MTHDDLLQPKAILLATDFSNVSDAAVTSARWLGGALRPDTLHVLHVLGPMVGPDALEEFRTADSSTLLGQALASAQNELDIACAALRDRLPGVTVVAHVAVGDAAGRILDAAEDLEVDLVIVGTHGRRGARRLFLGSVAERVVREAPCPVYVARFAAQRAADLIEPPCAECVAARAATGSSDAVCARHGERRGRAHTYSQMAAGFGRGSQIFWGDP